MDLKISKYITDFLSPKIVLAIDLLLSVVTVHKDGK